MLFKKPDVFKFKTLAQISSMKMIDGHSYCEGYKNDKGWAIIQDFIAHWVIKNEEMAIVWKSNSMHEFMNLWTTSIQIESNFQIFFIVKWSIKSWIIAQPL